MEKENLNRSHDTNSNEPLNNEALSQVTGGVLGEGQYIKGTRRMYAKQCPKCGRLSAEVYYVKGVSNSQGLYCHACEETTSNHDAAEPPA